MIVCSENNLNVVIECRTPICYWCHKSGRIKKKSELRIGNKDDIKEDLQKKEMEDENERQNRQRRVDKPTKEKRGQRSGKPLIRVK